MIRLFLSTLLQLLALFLAWEASPITFIGAGIISVIVLMLRPKVRMEIG